MLLSLGRTSRQMGTHKGGCGKNKNLAFSSLPLSAVDIILPRYKEAWESFEPTVRATIARPTSEALPKQISLQDQDSSMESSMQFHGTHGTSAPQSLSLEERRSPRSNGKDGWLLNANEAASMHLDAMHVLNNNVCATSCIEPLNVSHVLQEREDCWELKTYARSSFLCF
eukprot:scaffold30617_cov18-Tisochrysis_lutea.AAC.6